MFEHFHCISGFISASRKPNKSDGAKICEDLQFAWLHGSSILQKTCDRAKKREVALAILSANGNLIAFIDERISHLVLLTYFNMPALFRYPRNIKKEIPDRNLSARLLQCFFCKFLRPCCSAKSLRCSAQSARFSRGKSLQHTKLDLLLSLSDAK